MCVGLACEGSVDVFPQFRVVRLDFVFGFQLDDFCDSGITRNSSTL